MTISKDEILSILAHPVEAEAFAKGKAIERKMTDGWCEQPDPKFWSHASYRIKPEVHTAIRWVNIYKHGPGGSLHISEEEANRWVAALVVKCVAVTITWTEGEGLDDKQFRGAASTHRGSAQDSPNCRGQRTRPAPNSNGEER